MKQIIVIGGGAAGMMAAGTAAANGAEVTLLEKNDVLGKKLRITGKGRCNVTNAGGVDEFVANFYDNGPFLYSALYRFSNTDLRQFLSRYGVETKVERGQRVFPVSDDARDIVRALERYLKEFGVRVEYNHTIKALTVKNGQVAAVVDRDGKHWTADGVILTTGGASYPGTGSSGDGYELARQAGHRVSKLYPALVPLRCEQEWPRRVQGLNLRNVEVSLCRGDETLGREFGELLFTHFGVSGPTILTLSRLVAQAEGNPEGLVLRINLKPALSREKLDNRLQRDFSKYARKQFKNGLQDLLPKALIPVIVELAPIPADKPVHQITRAERLALADLLQGLTLTVTGTLPLAAAIVTGGGVATDEVDPRTMRSRLVSNLYFAGEILDLAANTGGYNLQAAFSTGYVAGEAAAQGL